LFRDFDLIAADKREDRCFDPQIHDVLPHRKKEETKYAIYHFYIQKIPRYSAFWSGNWKGF
jgi:hypothetical protein